MTLLRMDNVIGVVDHLDAIAFFYELGMELEGRPGPVRPKYH